MSADAPSLTQNPNRVFRTLTGLAEEFRAAAVRVMAYLLGILALALIAADLMSRVQDDMDMVPVPTVREMTWRQIDRPLPAFSAPVVDLSDKTATYDILRHPEGGRKDILRWDRDGAALSEVPASLPAPFPAMFPWAAIEIYRPGEELTGFGPATLEIAERVAPWKAFAMQTTGVIETKFGAATLVGFQVPAAGAPLTCTGFVQSFETPVFQISGWTCQGDVAKSGTSPHRIWVAQRQSAACLLNRLTLLAAGSDPKLAERFARAELKRDGDCAGETVVSANPDWISATDRPHLRGAVTARD